MPSALWAQLAVANASEGLDRGCDQLNRGARELRTGLGELSARRFPSNGCAIFQRNEWLMNVDNGIAGHDGDRIVAETDEKLVRELPGG